MPRNLRNFWIEIMVDGRKTMVKTGPRSKNGGFCINVMQRDRADIVTAARIEGSASGTGELTLRADVRNVGPVYHKTER